MPAGTAAFDVHLDASALVALIARYEHCVGDFSEIMSVAAEILTAAVSDKFDQGGPGWEPLAESTLLKRRGSTAQILVDTGRLAASIQGDHGPDFAEASTSVSYAVYHVSSAPRSHIPLRDFFDISEDVFEDIGAFLLEELSRA